MMHGQTKIKRQYVIEITVVKVQEGIRQIWAQNSKSFIVCLRHFYSRCQEQSDYFLES